MARFKNTAIRWGNAHQYMLQRARQRKAATRIQAAARRRAAQKRAAQLAAARAAKLAYRRKMGSLLGFANVKKYL